jgi:hypothetical protein
MEEYGPDICYIKGPEIIVADTLSHLPTTNEPEKPYVMPSHEELAECFAQETEEKWSFPISINLIKSFQQQDLDLIRKEKSNNPT